MNAGATIPGDNDSEVVLLIGFEVQHITPLQTRLQWRNVLNFETDEQNDLTIVVARDCSPCVHRNLVTIPVNVACCNHQITHSAAIG